MHFDRGAVQAHVFDVDGQDLLLLQAGKDPVQDAGLAPAIHPGVDGMPIAEMLRQTAPFTAMLHHIQQSIEQLQICHAYVAALPRQAVSYTLKLTFSDLHAAKNTQNIEKVN